MIYFDNAATTAMSKAALDALMDISANQYGNPSAVYGFGRKAKKVLDEAREIIAASIGADPEEIFFTSCGTESDNWVVNQIGTKFNRIITSAIEHHAVLFPAENCHESGIALDILPVDDNCLVSESSLQTVLGDRPALVSVMMQNNETGAIQNIKQMADLVHSCNKESVFHTDAVQAVGHINIDVHEMGIDMLSASAHKFNGPKGVGFLYISKSCNIDPFVLGGGQEKGMRSGTENVAGIYAMAKALEDNIKSMSGTHEHILRLESLLLSELRNENIGFEINGDTEHRATGILNLAIKGMDGEGLLNMLDMHGICISIGSACNSKSQDRSHVLKAMGLSDDRIDSSVRISIGRYNTEDDVTELVKCIKRCCNVAAVAEA
ncbi:cysteine desulfurase family protein [Bariatricus sp. HCP28S3_C2]|uniref:cysteine desulfurase family protein n=1 Tax=unclassified Bariatricus TaxID=2677046 RepID=UPI003F8BA37B